MVVVISTLIQIGLGFVSNALWTPDRKSIPWWDKLHWWFGRLLFLLAIVNTYLGIREFHEFGYLQKTYVGVTIGFWLFVAGGFVALLWGQFVYGQVHHKHVDES